MKDDKLKKLLQEERKAYVLLKASAEQQFNHCVSKIQAIDDRLRLVG